MSQSIPPQYGRVDSRKEEAQPLQESQDIQISSSSIPLEGPIDPQKYILGPGDKLGIDIISNTHMFFSLAVNPTGDILIPSVGNIQVAGISLEKAIVDITQLILDQYKNSKVHISLLEIRSFLVPITGAVLNPGHVQVYSTQRLWNILNYMEDLHPYADDKSVEISHLNREKEIISLKQYLIDGDDMNNPILKEGDRVYITFSEDLTQMLTEKNQAVEAIVWVTGFVEYPGSYKYIPGYTIQQYVGLAGGALEFGTEKGIYMQRSGKTVKGDIVKPGDKIIIPESLKSKWIGNASIMQTVTAFASLYLTYIAATK
ncbi:MAG: polysaccharide biosynthesis/export family protein [Candidatus Marinimicrobia bacterium]|nr:polysaccharide biosynthesis/export family protein [Candidatus Neomarinimicrobiota bacterium]